MGLNIALFLAGALLARGAIPAGYRLGSRVAWLAAGLFLALTNVKPHVVCLLWIVAAWWVVVRGRWSVAVGAATLWFQLLTSSVLPEAIDVHGPMLARPDGVMVLPMGLLFVVAFAGILPRPRVTWCIPLVWLELTFSRIWHGPLFAITAVLALGGMLPHVR